jgi:hypothetical protein
MSTNITAAVFGRLPEMPDQSLPHSSPREAAGYLRKRHTPPYLGRLQGQGNWIERQSATQFLRTASQPRDRRNKFARGLRNRVIRFWPPGIGEGPSPAPHVRASSGFGPDLLLRLGTGLINPTTFSCVSVPRLLGKRPAPKFRQLERSSTEKLSARGPSKSRITSPKPERQSRRPSQLIKLSRHPGSSSTSIAQHVISNCGAVPSQPNGKT